MLGTIGNQFRKPAGFLGKIVSGLMRKGNSKEYDIVIRQLKIQTNDRLFEIGYGHGLGIDRICSLYDCHVSGIDFSELMFREATKRNKRHIENKNAELFFGNFLDYNIMADTYDKIFCLNVIYFWDKLLVPFSKIRSALKEGGQFCFTMTHRDDLNRIGFARDDIFSKYTIEEVVDNLNHVGFKAVSYKRDRVYLIQCMK